uniref:NUDIX hydrolase n=1 Tax=Agathobacter sp. TaxID=2021311 RepID=UPI00405755A8
MELFDIVDENGIPTGETIERTVAHKTGVRHRTSHVWIVRKCGQNVEILLQKRCKDKDSFPGCYDISSAGHIRQGDDFVPSALRELEEELGIVAVPEELIDCGLHYKYVDQLFHGERFVDNQVSRVFLLWKDIESGKLKVQPEEIEEVRWFDFEECKQAVADGAIPNCIDLDELALLEEHM